MTKEYLPRIVDSVLDKKLKSFGATHIVGPKWCGKTTTAEQKCNSVLKLQKDPNKRPDGVYVIPIGCLKD